MERGVRMCMYLVDCFLMSLCGAGEYGGWCSGLRRGVMDEHVRWVGVEMTVALLSC